jgi:hypothetical protein
MVRSLRLRWSTIPKIAVKSGKWQLKTRIVVFTTTLTISFRRSQAITTLPMAQR